VSGPGIKHTLQRHIVNYMLSEEDWGNVRPLNYRLTRAEACVIGKVPGPEGCVIRKVITDVYKAYPISWRELLIVSWLISIIESLL
jgi:hypothetical protein